VKQSLQIVPFRDPAIMQKGILPTPDQQQQANRNGRNKKSCLKK